MKIDHSARVSSVATSRWALLLALPVALACDDPVLPPESIRITPDSASMIAGEESWFKAVPTPTSWSLERWYFHRAGSSWEEVDTIRAEWRIGVVRHTEAGELHVIARHEGHGEVLADTAILQVLPSDPERVYGPQWFPPRIERGSSLELLANLYDAYGNRVPRGAELWTSFSPEVVSVEGNVATGEGIGEAQIAVGLEPGEFQDTLSTGVIEFSGAWRTITANSDSVAYRFDYQYGWGDHTCAVDTEGAAFCWGANRAGQLGFRPWVITDPLESRSEIALGNSFRLPVDTDLRFQVVASGGNTTCALTFDGQTYCWGAAFLTDSEEWTWSCRWMVTYAYHARTPACGRHEPVAVSHESAFIDLDISGEHACAVDEIGGLHCIGRGQAGPSFEPVETDVPMVRVSAGDAHTCSVSRAGDVYCWGDNRHGQLGQGLVDSDLHPLPLLVEMDVEGAKAVAVSSGRRHSCVVLDDGDTYCWGSRTDGQLGEGSVSNEPLPVPSLVSGGLSWATVSAGSDHTCGVTTGGTGYCWGSGREGQLGTGETPEEPISAPVPVTGGLSFRTISAGYTYTCGVGVDDIAYCWGDGGWHGRLGTGESESAAPTEVGVPGNMGG